MAICCFLFYSVLTKQKSIFLLVENYVIIIMMIETNFFVVCLFVCNSILFRSFIFHHITLMFCFDSIVLVWFAFVKVFFVVWANSQTHRFVSMFSTSKSYEIIWASMSLSLSLSLFVGKLFINDHIVLVEVFFFAKIVKFQQANKKIQSNGPIVNFFFFLFFHMVIFISFFFFCIVKL